MTISFLISQTFMVLSVLTVTKRKLFFRNSRPVMGSLCPFSCAT